LPPQVEKPLPPDERVDASEHIHVPGDAAAACNGWKRILQVCAPFRNSRPLAKSVT
jgi:hypothetical protein